MLPYSRPSLPSQSFVKPPEIVSAEAVTLLDDTVRVPVLSVLITFVVSTRKQTIVSTSLNTTVQDTYVIFARSLIQTNRTREVVHGTNMVTKILEN